MVPVNEFWETSSWRKLGKVASKAGIGPVRELDLVKVFSEKCEQAMGSGKS
jgi:hypothetical protein